MTGAVVRRGRIMVDAGRAIHKLRDHLLADPSTWLCEVVRAAALSHATAVDISYDADDLYVRMDGDPWPAGVLESASALLGTDASAAGADRRQYLLAIGAFAALGHGAAAIELFVRTPSGVAATRVERAAFAGAGEAASAARSAPADGRGVSTLCLHVEHGLSAEVVGRFLGRKAPEAVTSLLSRLGADAPVVRVQGETVAVAAPDVLLTAPLEEHDAAVLVSPSHDRPVELVLEELGIVLARAPWATSTGLARAFAGVHLPLRVVLRSGRLPTNASRSRVDEDFVAGLGAALERALPALVDALRARAAEALAADPARAAALTDALGAFGVVVASLLDEKPGSRHALKPLLPVLDLPLLRDAVGRARSLSGARRVLKAGAAYVRRAEQPLAPEVQPFVQDVFWLAGRTAERYLEHARARPYEAIERDVARGAARRAAALSHPAAPIRLAPCPEHLIVHGATGVGGFRAAIALRAPGRLGEGCTVHAVVDGRLLETISFSESPNRIPFDAVVESPEVLRPTRAYDAVARDAGLERTVRRLGVLALDALLAGASGVPGHRAHELRALIGAASVALAGPSTGAPPTLRAMRIWPRVASGLLSTAEVAEAVAKDGGVRTITPEEARVALRPVLPASPVLILGDVDRRALRSALGADTRLVPYARFLGRGRSTLGELAEALAGAHVDASLVCAFERSGLRVAAAPAEAPSLLRVHRGTFVARGSELPFSAPLAVAIDDEALLPVSGAEPSPLPADLERLDVDVAAALLARADLAALVRTRPIARSFVLAVLGGRSALAPETQELLRRAPLFETILDGGEGPWESADRIAARYSRGIPVLAGRPLERLPGLDAIVLDEKERPLLERLTGRPVRSAAAIVDRLLRRARRAEAKRALLGASKRAAGLPPAGAHPSLSAAVLPSRPGVHAASVHVLADEVSRRVPHLTLLFDGREAGTFELASPAVPIAMLIDVGRAGWVPGSGGPPPRLLRAAGLAGRCAVVALAEALVRSEAALAHVGALEVVRLAVEELAAVRVHRALRTSDALAATVQGERVAWSLLFDAPVLRFGRRLHAPWPRASQPGPLDEPVLLLPDGRAGELLLAIVGAAGRLTVDVTDEIESLADERLSASQAATRAADMAPDDPRLRLSADRLGLPGVKGHVDIVAGPQSALLVERSGREPEVVGAEELSGCPCPVRGNVRLGRRASREAVLRGIAIKVARHLRDLAGVVDELPPFVGEHLRRHVVDQVARKEEVSAKLRAAKLFPTASGARASLEDLAKPHRIELDIPLGEYAAMHRALGWRSPHRPALDAEARAQCLLVAKVHRIGEGEVGVAPPSPAGPPTAAKITHLGRVIGTIRHLCGLAAAGAVEVPVALRSELASGVIDPERHAALVEAAEDALVESFDRQSVPGVPVLAMRFVNVRDAGRRIAGWLWVPDGPITPLCATTPAGTERLAPARAGGELPLGGRLLVSEPLAKTSTAGAVTGVAEVALDALRAELHEERRVELDAYLYFVNSPVHLGAPIDLVVGDAALSPASGRYLVGASQPLARALARWSPARIGRVHEVAGRDRAEPAEPGPALAPAPDPPTPVDDMYTGAPEPRLLDALLGLFGVRPVWNAPRQHKLVGALEKLLPRIHVPASTSLVFTREGRPVRYEPGRLIVDPEHPVVLALVQSEDMTSLGAAALTEIGRELDGSEAEERRVLTSLILES